VLRILDKPRLLAFLLARGIRVIATRSAYSRLGRALQGAKSVSKGCGGEYTEISARGRMPWIARISI